MHQATMAPNGPVAAPKVRGSEKIPAPTIEPTTMAVSANRESFCTDADAMRVTHANRLERSASWAPMLLRIAGRCVSRLKDALARTLSTLGQPPRRLRRGTRRWSRFDWRNAAQLLRYLRSIKLSCGNATRSASTISIITTNGAEPLNISPSDTRGSFNVLFTT